MVAFSRCDAAAGRPGGCEHFPRLGSTCNTPGRALNHRSRTRTAYAGSRCYGLGGRENITAGVKAERGTGEGRSKFLQATRYGYGSLRSVRSPHFRTCPTSTPRVRVEQHGGSQTSPRGRTLRPRGLQVQYPGIPSPWPTARVCRGSWRLTKPQAGPRRCCNA